VRKGRVVRPPGVPRMWDGKNHICYQAQKKNQTKLMGKGVPLESKTKALEKRQKKKEQMVLQATVANRQVLPIGKDRQKTVDKKKKGECGEVAGPASLG